MSDYGHQIKLIAVDSKNPVVKIEYTIMGIDGINAINQALKLAGEGYKYFSSISALKNNISDVDYFKRERR